MTKKRSIRIDRDAVNGMLNTVAEVLTVLLMVAAFIIWSFV